LLLGAAVWNRVVKPPVNGIRQVEEALGEIRVQPNGYAPRTAKNDAVARLILVIECKSR
jgi:hypothetical protein